MSSNQRFFSLLHLIYTPVPYILGFTCFILFHICFLPIWLPNIVLRAIAFGTAKCNKNLKQPLKYKDMIVWDDCYKQHRASILTSWCFNGDLSVERIKELFTSRVLQATLPNSIELRFPQLQQCQTTWLGFIFWKDCPNFDINNHIRELNPDNKFIPRRWENLDEFCSQVSCQPYKTQASPWELYVIRNVKPIGNQIGSKNTILILKNHHSMGDGLAARSILIDCLGQSPSPPVVKINTTPCAITDQLSFTHFVVSILNYFSAFYTFVCYTHLSSGYKSKKRVIHDEKGNVILKLSSRILLKDLKQVAAKYNTGVPAIITTLVAHSFSKVQNTKMKKLACSYILPIPNHPGNLINHSAGGMIELPINKDISIRERLEVLSTTFTQLKNNPVTNVLKYIEFLFGTLHPVLLRFIGKNLLYIPFAISNMCMSTTTFKVDGVKCIAAAGYVSPHFNTLDGTVVIIGFHDNVQACCTFDDRAFSEYDVTNIANGIDKALRDLIQNG